MLTVPPLDPRERARLDEQARNLAFIVTRGSHLSVRRERSARGEYLEHALDRALLTEYHAARNRIHWIDHSPHHPPKPVRRANNGGTNPRTRAPQTSRAPDAPGRPPETGRCAHPRMRALFSAG